MRVLLFSILFLLSNIYNPASGQTKQEALAWLNSNLTKALSFYNTDYRDLALQSVNECEFVVTYKDNKKNSYAVTYATHTISIDKEYGYIKYDGDITGALRTKNGTLEHYFVDPLKINKPYLAEMQQYLSRINTFCNRDKEVVNWNSAKEAMDWLQHIITKYGYSQESLITNPKIVNISLCFLEISYTHYKAVDGGWGTPEKIGTITESIPLSIKRLSTYNYNFQSDTKSVITEYSHNNSTEKKEGSILKIANAEPNLYSNIIKTFSYLYFTCGDSFISNMSKLLAETEKKTPPTGTPVAHEAFYANGKLKEKGQFINKTASGEWSFYYENGKLQAKGNYANGLKDGQWTMYHNNGKPHEQGAYSNDKQEGEWKVFYDNGKTASISNFSKGVQTGSWTFYHSYSGILTKSGVYNEKGEKTGEWIAYHENGKLKSNVFYDNGKKIGLSKEYHPNGKIFCEGYYDSNGKSTGAWKYYNESGVLTDINNYKEGVIISREKVK